MSKIVFLGWIGKTVKVTDFKRSKDKMYYPEVYPTKGNRSDWDETDWPPQRVKITIELA